MKGFIMSVWAAVKRPLEFLQNPQGEYSSKRLFGLAAFIVAIFLAFMGRDAAVVAVFRGAATGVFIAQAASGS